MNLMLPNPLNQAKNDKTASSRRAIVLIAVVALFAISLTLFGVWAQAAVQQQKRFHNQKYRLQAVRLAEAGVRRAVARRLADEQYETEVWRVPAEMLDTSHAAEVRIRVTAGGAAGTLLYEATAEYPVGAVRRAQITRRIDTINPVTEDES
jgi:type II secretory pathway pseudopilin PulG